MQKKKSKFRNIKLLMLDVDGVMTNGGIIYDSQGNEYKIFNVQDGTGIDSAIKSGIKVAFVSGRVSSIIDKRARELAVEDIYQGIRDKVAVLKELIIKYRIQPNEVCAVGDDTLDIALMKKVGFPVAVRNAREEVKKAAKYITAVNGGEGAVREVIELILK